MQKGCPMSCQLGLSSPVTRWWWLCSGWGPLYSFPMHPWSKVGTTAHEGCKEWMLPWVCCWTKRNQCPPTAAGV